MPAFHLAQLNVARAVAPLDDPRMADFVAQIDSVNAAAEAHPGFVWRLKDETGNAMSIRAFADPRMVVNLSVWRDAEALRDYVYRGDHVGVLRRRKEWFGPMEGPHLVLWWIPAGHTPTLDEAKARLDHLAAHGPTPEAFTFRQIFKPSPRGIGDGSWETGKISGPRLPAPNS